MLAAAGTLSLLLFAAAAVVTYRSDAPKRAVWPFGILVLALASAFLGGVSSNLHYLGVFLTGGTALAALLRTNGPPRYLVAGGVLTWMVALASARALFH